MSKAIEVGDLVLTVGTFNSEYLPHVGKIFTVSGPSSVYPRHWLLSPEHLDSQGRRMGWHERRLIRIDPPALADERETEKELQHG